MHRSRTSRTALLLVLGLGLAACGDDRERGAGATPGLSGPPMHEATRASLPSKAQGMLIRAQAACGLTFVVEGLESGTQVYPTRRLTAGQDVRIWWSTELESKAVAPAEPPTDAAAAGRTKDVSPRLSFAFEDMAILSAGGPFFVRPDTPQTAAWSYRAPLRPEALPFGTTLELCTFAIGDLAAGTLRVLPGAAGPRVVPGPGDVEAPDQVRVLRLRLRIEATE